MKKFASILIVLTMLFTLALGTLSVSAAEINPSTLEVGAQYTMSLYQANKGTTLYFDGTMSGYYYNGNTDASKAVALTAETADGGYRFFFMDGSTKKYLDVVANGTYINVIMTETPSGVFVYNADATTYTVSVGGTEYYIGTYSTYNTFSASKVSYITGDNASTVGVSNFPSVFTKVTAGDTTVAPDGTTATPDNTTETPAPIVPAPEVDHLADFDTVNTDQNTSYKDRTTTAGWTATFAATFNDKTFNNNVQMIVLNGKVSAPGTLTSPTINGIGNLSFSYGFPFSDTQFSLAITVKKLDGTVVVSETLTKEGLSKDTVYNYSLDVNTTEDVVIEFTNNALSAASNNKDRLGIWNLGWTDPAAAEETTASSEETTVPTEETTVPTEETTAPAGDEGGSAPTGDIAIFVLAAACVAVLVCGIVVFTGKKSRA